MSLDVYAAIAAKRDGRALDERTWQALIGGYLGGDVADYQMSALLMAVAIRGMDTAETAALTRAMIAYGGRIELGDLAATAVDKHSTGGVGDKTTLIVAPIVAACGLSVAKMSGRGLGHTGGTIDKLESIPGLRTDLEPAELIAQVREVGIAVVAQRADLVPADKALYALRDVTATVESVPLIAASIVSKKVAGGARSVVFDVKCGSGAFMRQRRGAEELGRVLVELARSLGLKAEALLSNMDQPLGRAVGNALEVREAIETLGGRGPEDLVELSVALAGRMIALGGGGPVEEARLRAAGALAEGAALERFRAWVAAQGGDATVVDDPERLPRAPVVRTVPAPADGTVTRLDALTVGNVARTLGAGRRRKDDSIDHRVGVICLAKTGETVGEGSPLAEVHAADEGSAEAAVAELARAYELGQRMAGGPARVVLADPLG